MEQLTATIRRRLVVNAIGHTWVPGDSRSTPFPQPQLSRLADPFASIQKALLICVLPASYANLTIIWHHLLSNKFAVGAFGQRSAKLS